MSNSKSLFIGQGATAPCWYRIALPSIHLENSDWVGIHRGTDEPMSVKLAGNTEDYPNPDDYDVIVVQQPRGEKWRQWIEDLQSRGKKVYFECDDYLHGIYKIKDHRNRANFPKSRRKEFEICMKQADGMIVSTEALAKEYKKFNDNQIVCLVSLDTNRYNIKVPDRKIFTVGWAGGTGHHQAVGPWLGAINSVMMRNPHVGFVSIGTNYAEALSEYHPERTLSIPWTTIENYPYALANIDLMICPSHDSKYFKAKSDLRYLEASAVGIPCIVDDRTYIHTDPDTAVINELPDMTRAEGFELELEASLSERKQLKEQGAFAQGYVQGNRDIKFGKEQWEKILQ